MATTEDVVWKLERPLLVLIAFITDEGYKKKTCRHPHAVQLLFFGRNITITVSKKMD